MLAYADTESERITDNERGREQSATNCPFWSRTTTSISDVSVPFAVIRSGVALINSEMANSDGPLRPGIPVLSKLHPTKPARASVRDAIIQDREMERLSSILIMSSLSLQSLWEVSEVNLEATGGCRHLTSRSARMNRDLGKH